jgi:hypothetical protein
MNGSLQKIQGLYQPLLREKQKLGRFLLKFIESRTHPSTLAFTPNFLEAPYACNNVLIRKETLCLGHLLIFIIVSK